MIHDAQELLQRLNETLEECERLREEVRRLESELGIRRPSVPEPCGPAEIIAPATKADRVTLFRSLFRGREDVYAQRIQFKKTGLWGYVPHGERDWDALRAARPEDKKDVDIQTRKLYPLTDKVIELHLSGKMTSGLYPLLADETCWLLAADFDKKTWEQDAVAFVATCRQAGVDAYLERSRSGNGGHVWIFFESAIPAVLARKLGCAMLTRTMEQRHQIGLDSYDRFFPNQDTMPKGGFGNLIALPLQWIPRQSGNSVFVDDRLQPYPDQWRMLAAVKRVGADRVEWIVNDATRRNQVVGVRLATTGDDGEDAPWVLPPSRKRADARIAGPFPEEVELVQGNLIYVPRAGLPEPMLNRILRLAAFQNPEFYKSQAMRLSTWKLPRIIFCGEDLGQYLGLPRGCRQELCDLLQTHGIRVKIRDERFTGKAIDLQFTGVLRDEQAQAIQQVLQHDEGILCAPTAFGKTVVAAALIAERRANTLVLLHRQQLLDQWRERLAMFLGLPVKSIGHVSGGKEARTGIVDVALLQSCFRKKEVKDFVAEYGQVIVDECHHITAFTFEQVMRQVKAKYVVGLTATPTRKDGHQPILYMQCGPIRFTLSAKDAAARHPFEHVVVPRFTDFRMSTETAQTTIQDIYRALTAAEERTLGIAADIRQALRDGLTPLVLSSRVEHISRLAAALSDLPNVVTMKGGMGKKQRQEIMDQLASIPKDSPRVIVATGSYIGEGFDDPRLDTLFLTMPISWQGTLQQYVGRLHRLHEGKKTVRVYDYVDTHVPMLARMYDKRLKGYRNLGYVLEDPGHRQ